MRSSAYRPEIDGLRAVAVLPVVCYHAKLGFTGGFVGVDVFFVISGFLITSLIHKELVAGTFDLTTFWTRRVRRLLPALSAVVVAVLVAGWFTYLPENFASLGEATAAQAVLLSNFYADRHTDYFAAAPDTLPLLHFWSLAVEEQFYLVYPLALLLLARSRRLSVWFRACAFVFALSLVLSVVGSHVRPIATFYLLPARAWELLLGALVVAVPNRNHVSPLLSEMGGIMGLVLIAYPALFYSSETLFPGLSALPPCLGAALIILTNRNKPNFAGKTLSLRPLVFVGLISYSLYLWHWPLLCFVNYISTKIPGVGTRMGYVLLSVIIAALSWKYIEVPFRRPAVLKSSIRPLVFAATVLSIFLAAGLLIARAEGFPSRFSSESLRYAEFAHERAFLNEIDVAKAKAGQFPPLGTDDLSRPIDVLVWGDSHAMALTPVIDSLCRQLSLRGVEATHSSTPPVLDYVCPSGLKNHAPAFAETVVAFVAKEQIKTVILAAKWESYVTREHFDDALISTVETLTKLGVRVVVCKQVPRPRFDVPRHAALLSRAGGDPEKTRFSLRKGLEQTAHTHPVFDRITTLGAVLLDPYPCFVAEDGQYRVVKDGHPLFCDDHHLSVSGAMQLSPLFDPVLRACLRKNPL